MIVIIKTNEAVNPHGQRSFFHAGWMPRFGLISSVLWHRCGLGDRNAGVSDMVMAWRRLLDKSQGFSTLRGLVC